MNYYLLRPEVAGGLGPQSKVDTSVHPPVVTRLHFVVESWLGDDLVETFPCFLVTERLADALRESGFSGFRMGQAETSFEGGPPRSGLSPGKEGFLWLKVHGVASRSDIGITPDAQLVVSERVLQLLRRYTLSHCEVAPCG